MFIGVTLGTCRRWLIKIQKAVAHNLRMSKPASIFVIGIQVAAGNSEQVCCVACCVAAPFSAYRLSSAGLHPLLSGDSRNLDTFFRVFLARRSGIISPLNLHSLSVQQTQPAALIESFPGCKAPPCWADGNHLVAIKLNQDMHFCTLWAWQSVKERGFQTRAYIFFFFVKILFVSEAISSGYVQGKDS